MIRGITSQLHGNVEGIHKGCEASHKLCTPRMIFRAIVLVDDQGAYGREARLLRRPKIRQAVDNEITGDFGLAKVKIEFPELGEINAKGNHFRRFGSKIMIPGFHNDATQAAARKTTNKDRRFGIPRQPQHRFVGVSRLIDLVHLCKNGIGFRKLLERLVFFTGFNL